MTTVYILAIIVCILLSGFFSASEMSFSSSNKIRLENMVDDEVKGAALALKVAELGADGPIEIDDEECVAKSFPAFRMSRSLLRW